MTIRTLSDRATQVLLALCLISIPLALMLIFAHPPPVHAAGPWYVAPGGSDSNDCASPGTPCATINSAIGKASSGDTILVASGTFTSTGAFTYTASEVVSLNKNATLSGGWDGAFAIQIGMSAVDGQNARRGMTMNSGTTAIVDHFIFQNGLACGGAGISNSGTLTVNTSSIIANAVDSSVDCGGYTYGGGGISNNGFLSLNNSTVAENTAAFGGGISHGNGTLILNNSTVSKNTAQSLFGGGISSVNAPLVLIRSSTISANMGPDAGIYNQGGSSITLFNSIVAGNRQGASPADCGGIIGSGGYNILGNTSGCSFSATTGDLTNINASLGPLSDNGGPTLTHALTPSSAAINGGNPAGCTDNLGNLLSTDQRGSPRFGTCDIGAYELQPLGFSTKSVAPGTASPGASLAYTITLSNPGTNDLTNVSVTDTLPIAITYTSSSLNASSGSYGSASGVITWTGTLSATTSTNLTFGATVNSNAPSGNIVNAAIINGGGETFTRTASFNIPAHVYLPLILKQPTLTPTPTPTSTPTPTPTATPIPYLGIHGHVTFNGATASGVSLLLRFYNGSSWSTLATTTTDINGNYYFLSAPTLGGGQQYHVRYLNNSDNTKLYFWDTRYLTTYTAGTSVAIGDFDIANIPLVSPSSGAIVSLPQTFQWTRRSATTTDSYEFDLFNPGNPPNYTPVWWTYPPLGYVSSYSLNSLPSGFSPGVQYGWFIAVYSPDGGYGESFYYRPVTFSNTGFGPALGAPLVPSTNQRERLYPKMWR
jgi:uncharacterized repeat protein (TIGR01451 family)